MSRMGIGLVGEGIGSRASENTPPQLPSFLLLPRPPALQGTGVGGRGSRRKEGARDVWPRGNVPEGRSTEVRTTRKNP